MTRSESFMGYLASAIVVCSIAGAFWAWLTLFPRALAWAMGWEYTP